MARKVERLSRNVPVSREVLVGTVAKVDHGVTDRGHELLVSARTLFNANLHVFIQCVKPMHINVLGSRNGAR